MVDVYFPSPDCTDLQCPKCKRTGCFSDIEREESEGEIGYFFICKCGEAVEAKK
mgnify:CR=1 FL=1